jgi:Zn-dependent protease with chaperone function
MSTTEVTPADQLGPRPNLLAYPSPTTSRFIVFVAALLAAGAFVGGWIHSQVLGAQWLSTVARCEQQAAALPVSALGAVGDIQRNAAAERCRASAERRRAAFSFGGALLAGGAGLAVLFLVPPVLERRRRLRQLPPTLATATERAAELTRAAGMRTSPTLMLGPLSLTDAFSYGTPGHYRIALPPAVAVRWRDPALFDPLIDHELAHIEHRDVALAWLARSVWYALAPLLALPIVVSIFRGDLSLIPDYVWRAALLALTVQLTSTALLRSREYDADLRAAQATGGAQRVAALVARARDAGARPWWRRIVAKHPSTADRLAVLEQPQIAARVTAIDGLTTGFLAGLSIPVIVSVVTTLLIGSGHTDDAIIIASCLAGPLLAGSVGLGFCRATIVNRLDGRTTPLLWPALGVGFGLALGEATSLAQTGAGAASLHPLAWLPLLAVLGVGVTVLAGSEAELLADAAPAARGPRTSWMSSFLVIAVLYSGVLWIGTSQEIPLSLGWVGFEAWLVTALESPLVLIALAVPTATVVWWVWAMRRPRVAPPWAIEHGDGSMPWVLAGRHHVAAALSTGLLAGGLAAAVLVVHRVLAGPAATELAKTQRFYLLVWMGAAAALASAAPLAFSRAPRGAALGVFAGAIACLVTVAGWLATYASTLSWSFVSSVAKQPLALSLPAVTIAALGMLVQHRRRIRLPVTYGLTVAIALGCSGVLVAKRASLPPFGQSAGTVVNTPAGAQATAAMVDALLYTDSFAPRVVNGYAQARSAFAAIVTDSTIDDATRSSRIDTEVVRPLQALLSAANAYHTRTARVQATNALAVSALRNFVLGYQAVADGLAAEDPAPLVGAKAMLANAQSDLTRWGQQVLDLSRTNPR